jgi:hypothetical protein
MRWIGVLAEDLREDVPKLRPGHVLCHPAGIALVSFEGYTAESDYLSCCRGGSVVAYI